MTHPFISASKELIQPVLSSKMEEFHMLGYEEVTENDLLSYLEMKKWKKERELSLHQVVNDILSVKITQVMSYVTIESYKSDMFSSVNNNGEDWKELLK
ncbi:post-transcriptional regulator [Priestia megaterium]|uniref:Post-transcriptional regulator n=2 Tax=Priestia megaterium TaxID=1404 RepID=A0AAE5U8Y3_PRIMG|nr:MULTISPECIES: post-transcriptional regulator [Priestia]RFB25268.1 post-transcriptional regulator [Bacillus sp. ALD]RFB37455.1 post-transcriptional regulator [Bacillus sp. RC]MBV6733084.1 post-transcriptional regulator [Priestia megaterium]MDC7782489.1 post-transcriptional regulator [Priestia megaterium]PES27054.1 post-transcriptional regulator [Priestia megaterium]